MNTNNKPKSFTEDTRAAPTRFRPGSHRRATRLLLAGLVALVSTSAQAAPTITGTYVTSLRQGSLSYTQVAVVGGRSSGNFLIDGRKYPGVVDPAGANTVKLAWFYGTMGGVVAGSALVTPQADGTYSGLIYFFDRAGNTTDTGTVTLH